eukprot:1228924-Amphidinium_carterae.1
MSTVLEGVPGFQMCAKAARNEWRVTESLCRCTHFSKACCAISAKALCKRIIVRDACAECWNHNGLPTTSVEFGVAQGADALPGTKEHRKMRFTVSSALVLVFDMSCQPQDERSALVIPGSGDCSFGRLRKRGDSIDVCLGVCKQNETDETERQHEQWSFYSMPVDHDSSCGEPWREPTNYRRGCQEICVLCEDAAISFNLGMANREGVYQ